MVLGFSALADGSTVHPQAEHVIELAAIGLPHPPRAVKRSERASTGVAGGAMSKMSATGGSGSMGTMSSFDWVDAAAAFCFDSWHGPHRYRPRASFTRGLPEQSTPHNTHTLVG